MGKGQKLYIKAKSIVAGGNMLLSKRPEMFLPEKWPSYFSKTQGFKIAWVEVGIKKLLKIQSLVENKLCARIFFIIKKNKFKKSLTFSTSVKPTSKYYILDSYTLTYAPCSSQTIRLRSNGLR